MPKKSGFHLKLDLEKAYDKVDGRFLVTLELKGFGWLWRKWIRGSLKTTNSYILINGIPRGKFLATRGIVLGWRFSTFVGWFTVSTLLGLGAL